MYFAKNDIQKFKKHWINIDVNNKNIDDIHNEVKEYVHKYIEFIKT